MPEKRIKKDILENFMWNLHVFTAMTHRRYTEGIWYSSQLS
jgi:hypothetical protein